MDLLQKQQKCYADARHWVEMAISLEESNPPNSKPKCVQLYQKAIELLKQAQQLEFPPSQWDKAAEVQLKVWKTFQMAANRVKELSNGQTYLEQNKSLVATPIGTNLASFVETLAKLNTGDYAEKGMTRSQEIDANRSVAQNLLKNIQPNPTTEPHLGLPNNLRELADLVIEASLLPKPGSSIGKGSIAIPPNTIEQLKKTQFVVAALAREPEQKWKDIHWCLSISDALSKAQLQDKPIFLEMVVGRLGQKESQVC